MNSLHMTSAWISFCTLPGSISIAERTGPRALQVRLVARQPPKRSYPGNQHV
jgi:hypothetical protein